MARPSATPAELAAAHHALAISSVADFDERVPLHLAVAAKNCTEGILQTASLIARHRNQTEISEKDIQLAIEAHTMRTDSQPQPLKDLHARADLINAQDLPLSNVLGVQLPPPHMRGVVSTPGPVPPSSVTGRSALSKAAAADLRDNK